MPLSLHALTLPELHALLRDASHIGDMRVAGGALPGFLVASAARELESGKPAYWHAPVLFVRVAHGDAVGSAMFKGEPMAGRVELGYGVGDAFQGKGFASLGVQLMLDRAYAVRGVTEVYAESAPGNAASTRVLEKCGFHLFGQHATAGDGIVNRWLARGHFEAGPTDMP